MVITFPVLTPVMSGNAPLLNLHAGVAVAAPAVVGPAVEIRVIVEANNMMTPRVEAIRWRIIGGSFAVGAVSGGRPSPPVSRKADIATMAGQLDRRCAFTRVSRHETDPSTLPALTLR